MKKLLFPLFVASATFASTASAVDVGLGAQLDGTSPTIVVPLEVTPSIRVEPFLAFADDSTDTTDSSLFALGAGVFFKSSTAPNAKLYAGGRLGIALIEDTTTAGATKVTDEMTTLSLEPTAGLEYSFSNKFSLAGEAGLRISTTDADSKSCTGATCVTSSGDSDELGTFSRIIARFYF